jgi:hypothetical protein
MPEERARASVSPFPLSFEAAALRVPGVAAGDQGRV